MLSEVTSIHFLDDEKLGTIFKFLPYIDRLNMENVCEKWKVASKSKSWNEVKSFCAGDYYFYNQEHFRATRPPQEIVEQVIIRCGPFLNRLVLSDYITSSIMKVVAEYCCNITYFSLGIDDYNPMDFVGAFDKLKKLHTIKILTKSKAKFHPGNFRSLTTDINTIYYSVGTYGESPGRSWYNDFSLIFPTFNLLQSLNFRDMKFDKSTFKIITKLHSLKHLGLIFCKLPSNAKKIKKLDNLESLELERIANMDNEFIENFVNLKSLKCVSIKNLFSRKVTRQGFYRLSEPTNLRSIRICMMEDIDNTVFFQFQNLIKLECCGCPRITDAGMARVLQNCHELEVLNVMGTNITVTTLVNAYAETRYRFGNAPKLYLFAHRNVIKDYVDLNKPENPFLILDHDVFWENQSRIFT